jgi:hypothetical protein
MSDRARMTDERLGAALGAVDVAWPATPELASNVTATIRDVDGAPRSMRPRLSLPSRRRTVLMLVAALLVLAVAAVATKLVIDLGAVTIQATTGTPPASLPVFAPETFGEPVADAAAASSRAGFDVVVPAELGTPDHVWVWETPPYRGASPADQVILAWDPSPTLPRIEGLPYGAVLMELTGKTDLVTKTLYAASTTVQPIMFRGARAYWVQGPHTIAVEGPMGNGAAERTVTGNVFLWTQDGRAMRLETALGLDPTMDVALSMS